MASNQPIKNSETPSPPAGGAAEIVPKYTPRTARRRDCVWLYLGNTGLTVLLQAGYIVGVSFGLHGMAATGFALAIISQAALLNFIPAVISAWPLLDWRRRVWARIFAGVVYGLFQLALVIDIVTYRLFQRHFDGQVWEVLNTRGAGDSMHVDALSVGLATGVAVLLIAGNLGLAVGVVPRLVIWRPRAGFWMLLLAVLGERVALATVDLSDPTLLPAIQSTLPLYMPLSIRGVARHFGYTESEPYVMPNSTGELVVPANPLGLKPDARTPNILFIAIEGGRFDALDEKTMPNLLALSRDSLRLENHFSTGNETRFGIFGIIYGLPGNYWVLALKQGVTPPWFDLLANAGYEFKILSCTDMNFPGFRQTCFRRLTPFITDQWPDLPRVDRDRVMAETFTNFLEERSFRIAEPHPFFGFLFFDASHQSYIHPPEDNIYESVPSGEINYMKLALSPAGGRELKGSYLNALHYIDRQIGMVVAALKQHGDYDNTIIVVAGDHGEEFGEMGHFGHGSAFNRYQTQTFAVMHLPGGKPGDIENLTSHADFVPSVLTWMGVTNALTDYTTGVPIQGTKPRKWTLLSSWQDTAMRDAQSITVFEQDQTRYLDLDYQDLRRNDPRRASDAETKAALKDVGRFLK